MPEATTTTTTLAAGGQGSSLMELRFEDVLSIIFKWKWVILFFAVTIPIIASLIMLTVKPLYTATSIVTVKTRTPESQTLGGQLVPNREVLTELDESLFIKSRMVLNDVVRELKLNVDMTKEKKLADFLLSIIKGQAGENNFRDSVKRINLSGEVSAGVYIDFISPDQFTVTTVKENKYIGKGRLDELFQCKYGSFLLEDFPHKIQDKFLLKYQDVDQVARQLASRINVKTLGHSKASASSLSLEISADGSDPKTATQLANTIASVYLKCKKEEAGETISQVLRFIKEQMGDLTVRTEESVKELENFREKEGLFFVEETAKSKLSSISALDMEVNEMELQMAVLENLLYSIRQGARITSKQVMLISASRASIAASIAQRINELQLERKAMERKYTEKHPEMQANESKIEEARKMLVEALESQIELFRRKINTNRNAQERYTKELSELNDGMRNLKRYERVSIINERLLTYLMRRNEETKIQQASVIANVKIIRQAPGAYLVKPRRERYIISGILAGLLVGVGVAFLLESMDNTIKNPSWIEKELGLPVYGMIPNFASGRPDKTGVATSPTRGDLHLIMKQDPKSMVAESYRALRTNISFSNIEKAPKIILFTSPAPREGKSTTIANLAITMANMGNKVLVLDCDLRKPIMHRFFSIPRENGITEALTQNINWREVVKATEIENCYVMTSGKSPPNPSELLGSKKMKQLLAECSEEYDTILIDSSPVIPVTDAVVLASEVESVFLIIELGRTTTTAVQTTMNALRTVHVDPAGAIINNIRPEDRRAYGYGYGYRYGPGYRYYRYYDYYSYYYTDEERSMPKSPWQAFMDKILGRKDDAA